jgi:hypothetical protein
MIESQVSDSMEIRNEKKIGAPQVSIEVDEYKNRYPSSIYNDDSSIFIKNFNSHQTRITK